MIRLFVSDIDGCLAEAYRPYDLAGFGELAGFIAEAPTLDGARRAPAFSICSGRPYSYVEAVTQALGVRLPVLFESGGGMFDPVRASVRWHPALTAALEADLEVLRRWFREAVVPGTSMMLDFGKRTQAGIIGPDADEVAALVPEIEAYTARHFPHFCVFSTSVSIDVVPKAITKREGLAWLADVLGCPLSEVAFIGDTDGDLGALAAAGVGFAPANATAAVKAAADEVLPGRVLDAVLAAYRWCLRHNAALLPESA